jgi:putative endonuclease
MNDFNIEPSPREKGAEAEHVAVEYLKKHGLRVCELNYHTRQGEIDIVARENDQLVFIEVKSSSKPSDWYAGERIDQRKRRRMQLAALHYIASHEIPAGGMRFDAVIMVAARGDEWSIEHIRDAFIID